MTAIVTPARPCFVSFFCGAPAYARAAAVLRSRCEALGIPLLVEALPDAGHYWKNTLLKPAFIRDKLVALRRDVIWIDVDTILHGDHAAFRTLEADLTLASHSGDLAGMKASPVGVAHTAPALAVVEAWAEACRVKGETGDVDLDHDVLKYEILPAFAGKATLRLLGDPDHTRDFVDGRTLTNGLSRLGGDVMPRVLARNRRRAGPFAALSLADFHVAATVTPGTRRGEARGDETVGHAGSGSTPSPSRTWVTPETASRTASPGARD